MAEKPKPQILVIDASVAAKWFINEPDSPIAGKLLEEAVAGRWVFAAPDLMRLELSHVFWKRRAAGYTQKQLEHALQELGRLGMQEAPMSLLLSKAVELAYQAELAVYDACYAALALSLKSALATFDQDLMKKIKRHSLLPLHPWAEIRSDRS